MPLQQLPLIRLPDVLAAMMIFDESCGGGGGGGGGGYGYAVAPSMAFPQTLLLHHKQVQHVDSSCAAYAVAHGAIQH